MGVGMLTAFSVGVESSGGTSGTSGVTPCDFVAIISETLASNPQPIESQGLRAQWDVQKMYNGLETVGGNVAMEIHPANIGYFFRSWFDTCTVADVGSAGFGTSNANFKAHRFVAANGQFQAGSGSDLPTLTFNVFRGPTQIQASAPSSAFAFLNMAANVMNIQIEAGQLVKADFDYLGRDYARVAASVPAFPAADAFLWNQCSVSINGVGTGVFETLNIRGNNNLTAVPLIGGRLRADLVKRDGFRIIEVNGRISFQGDNEYDTFRNGTETGLKIHFKTTSPASFQVNIDAPAFRYITFPLGTQGPGRNTIDFTGRANFHPGSGSALTITVVNTRLSSFLVNTNA